MKAELSVADATRIREAWLARPREERRRIFLTRLVWELRNGGHRKARGQLRRVSGCMCVMGIALNMGAGRWGQGWRYFGGTCTSVGNVDAAMHTTLDMGLTRTEVNKLIALNDSGKSFNKIADFIESEWLK